MTLPRTAPGLLGRVLLATSIAALLCTSTASAGSSEEIRTSGAWAKFDDLGEDLMVGDIAKDRKGARAYLRWAGGNSASVHVSGYAKPLDTRDLSIPEGTKVTLTVCYTKRGVDVQCSDFQWAEA
ncbi:MAG TPA: hypothetical protein VNO82_15670 [Solirubrobacteraceae bacterium]|nr:hypothetical protein [Solirubrobacteraceae bacterium]